MDFNWLWIVPVLGILVVVHELGHFWTALLFKIRVEEFGIGFPPRAFAIRRNGIDYSINWLPIGGFVKIVGENGDSDDPRSFGRAPAWQRIIVLAAGSAMNLLLALLIFAGLAIGGTQEIDAPNTVVGIVQENQPAFRSGMQPGDRIVRVAGQSVADDDAIRALSRENQGKPTEFVVERDGKELSLTVTPNVNPAGGAYLGINLGYWISEAVIAEVRPGSIADDAQLKPGDEIVSVDGKQVDNLPDAMYLLTEKSTTTHQVVVKRNGEPVGPLALNVTDAGQRPYGLSFERPIRTVYYSPGEAMGRALSSTWDVIASVPRGIGEAIAGQAQGPGVTGPVGIGQLTGEVAQESGVYGLLNLTALLGISLFMINLLPLPALDGGRLLFIFIELLRGGRRIAPEKEGMVHVAGMVVLLALMVIISFFDIKRLFDGACLLC
jgi:regulator of sigma E protease